MALCDFSTSPGGEKVACSIDSERARRPYGMTTCQFVTLENNEMSTLCQIASVGPESKGILEPFAEARIEDVGECLTVVIHSW